MKGVIDRFEGNYAVVELDDGNIKNIEKNKLPEKAKEGDVLILSRNITIDNEETLKRKVEIEKLTKNLWE